MSRPKETWLVGDIKIPQGGIWDRACYCHRRVRRTDSARRSHRDRPL